MLIERKAIHQQLKSLRDADVIKVITGVRRSGKSTVMQMFKDYLFTSGVNENQIVFMNFEEIENTKWLDDYENLYHHIIDQLDLSKSNYVFLDEVQNVKNFERLIDGFFVKPNIDLYVTGSNAHLLSSELGTLLTGRYIEIHVLPFSFLEFSQLQTESNIDRSFSQYLGKGGFPGVVQLDESQQQIYANSIIESIKVKDIFIRNKWKSTENFDKTLSFLMDSIGSPVSATNIANTFVSAGTPISHNTISEYLEALCESFLLYRVPRYDVRGKKLLTTLPKYYVVDIGMKKSILGEAANQNLGHNLENVVFLELIHKGFKVYSGKVRDSEVDFIAISPKGDKQYFQVAYSVRDETTQNRELSSLKMIRDNNPKTLLTMDTDPAADFDGIKRKNVVDWLLETSEKGGDYNG
ncbi:MAG: ATP-binding protein [Candidatus Ancillula sp.]|jgi:predicted AAA+ superfamily ATPase|nr:ATP-binding protein [Candidatus Ancillula sp.]